MQGLLWTAIRYSERHETPRYCFLIFFQSYSTQHISIYELRNKKTSLWLKESESVILSFPLITHERQTGHKPAVHLLSLEDLSLKDCPLGTQVFDVGIFHIFSNILRGWWGARYTWKQIVHQTIQSQMKEVYLAGRKTYNSKLLCN